MAESKWKNRDAFEDVCEALEKSIRELNEIRARDGVPYTSQGWKSSVDEDYFASVVDGGFAALAKAQEEPKGAWRQRR